jgi:hypothetical protein
MHIPYWEEMFMSLELRAQNLHLARHLCGGLGNLAKELVPETNEAALIKMGQGKKEISDATAQLIEQRLGLPAAWMDRDNEILIRISAQEYAIHKRVSVLPEEAKQSLLILISSLPVAK